MFKFCSSLDCSSSGDEIRLFFSIHPCICSVQFYLAIQLFRVQIPFVNSIPFFLSLQIVKQLGCRAIFLTLVFELSMKTSAEGWSTKSWRQIWRSSCPLLGIFLTLYTVLHIFTRFYTRYLYHRFSFWAILKKSLICQWCERMHLCGFVCWDVCCKSQ